MNHDESIPNIQRARLERQRSFRRGLSAETRAVLYLMAKGFRILARRWKSPVGEIDIIARRHTLLLFVEVKARASLNEAAESLTPHQRRRIIAAAQMWLAMRPDSRTSDIRFDVILMAPYRWPQHIQAAFEASC